MKRRLHTFNEHRSQSFIKETTEIETRTVEEMCNEMGLEILKIINRNPSAEIIHVLFNFVNNVNLHITFDEHSDWSYAITHGAKMVSLENTMDREAALKAIKRELSVVKETFVPKNIEKREADKAKIDAEKAKQAEEDAMLLLMLLPTFKKFFPKSKDVKPKDDDPNYISFSDYSVMVPRIGNDIKNVVVHWNIVDHHKLGIDAYGEFDSVNSSILHIRHTLQVSSPQELEAAFIEYPKGWIKE